MWLTRLATESGLAAVATSRPDVHLLFALRFVRLFAYGASFLVLVPLLARLGIPDARIGAFMTLTLLGDAAISMLLAAVTDRVGRRRVLALGAALMAVSGAVFATSNNWWVLLLASVVGVISPGGGEIGPFRAVEESVLAHLTAPAQRSDVFAWYALAGAAGSALGSLAGGLLVAALERQTDTTGAYRGVFVVYAAVGVVKLLLTLGLSAGIEVEEEGKGEGVEREDVSESDEQSSLLPKDGDRIVPALSSPASLSPPLNSSSRPSLSPQSASSSSPPSSSPPSSSPPSSSPPSSSPLSSPLSSLHRLFPPLSPRSRRVLARLLLLFALDSLGSGMASPAWLTYFFVSVHRLAPAVLGTLFLVTSLLAAVSTLLALPLARRLGPLRTMVLTHLPSTLLLAAVPLPPPSPAGTPLAMGLLALRACTQSMDQAPRQAFLAAAVLPGERTAVLGAVNLVKTLVQAAGVGVAGVLAGEGCWIGLLSGAGLLKASYDVLLLWSAAHLQAGGR